MGFCFVDVQKVYSTLPDLSDFVAVLYLSISYTIYCYNCMYNCKITQMAQLDNNKMCILLYMCKKTNKLCCIVYAVTAAIRKCATHFSMGFIVTT